MTTSNRIGETNIATNGQKMTIVRYNGWYDIDVQFEDGTIVEHRSYGCFTKGNIKHPNLDPLRKDSRIGETNIANNGQKMTIVKYKNSNDIDVQFEDGAIINHKTYTAFLKGHISNPNYHPNYHKVRNDRIGETNIATNGQKITIVRYNGCNDIDVQFEDGTVIEHKDYDSFSKGFILNPNYHPHYHKKADRVGETNIAKNGQKMTIVRYYKTSDIDIQFEDGFITTHKTYINFITGNIKHHFPYQMNDNMIIEKPAYVHNKIGNFYCHCILCGKRDIMTISEVKNHVCNKTENGD